ncbi:cobalamin biosynthesis protein [Bradyrhizobium sp. STM 3557]|uniref:cobalamin biosynthesis protein n=1 Tax=Bradyrhizobium sp. STM 3557 TaxID=578920 RepID=UPI00388D45FB
MAGQQAMIALGIGCRRNAPIEDIEAVIARALSAASLPAAAISVIATENDKMAEPGLVEAARRLDRPLRGVVASEMARMSDLAVTRSERVQALKGVPSVAETAALAAIGQGGRLIVPRVANATATCALASDDAEYGK